MLPDAYGCVVANRYGELLDDDADPFDLIREVETEKDKKKKNNNKKKEEEKKSKQKKPGQKESQRDRRVPMSVEAQEPLPARKNQQMHAEGGDSREEAQRGMKRSAAGQQMVKQEGYGYSQDYRTDKPYNIPDSDLRGRGAFRGKMRGRSAQNPEKINMREMHDFDRHSKTGMSPEEKRGGRGPYNWGCVEDAAKEMMEVTSDNKGKSNEPQTSVEELSLTGLKNENEEIVVHVAMEMTLDEWKAMQENTRSKAEFNLRKAEDKIPTKAKVIHQSKNLENVKITTEDLEEESHFLRRSVNDITSLLDINFGSLGRPTRGGRGRGTRGGHSVCQERTRSLMERGDSAPNPDDPEDFPALPGGK